MKCINCGADVRLTDKVCPYCGRVIKENAGYRADMEYYKRDSAKTKKKVREILSENIPIVISAIILVVLLIADGVLLYVQFRIIWMRGIMPGFRHLRNITT